MDMTRGKPWRLITAFAIPVLLSQVFQQLYNTADALIVGRFLGDEALAAVSSSGTLIFLIISFFTGMSMGASVTISRYFGAGDYARVSRAIHTNVLLAILCGIVLTVFGVALTPTFLRWMGTDPDVLPEAISYFRYYFFGILAVVMYNTCKGIMNALGDSRRPLYYLMFSSALNVALDLLFILSFGWGVAGAAIATVLAQLLSTIACFIYAFAHYPQLRLSRQDFALTRSDICQHIIQGIPLGLQFSVLAIGIIIMQSVVVQFDMVDGLLVSSAAQNGYGAANKLFCLISTPLNALGVSMTSFTAQNLGAGDYKRIRQGTLQALIMLLIVGVLSATIGLLLSIDGLYLRVFLSADKVTPETIRYGNTLVYVDFGLFLLVGFIYIIRNCIQGIERPQYVLCAGAGELIARITVCLLLPAAVAGGKVDANARPLAFYALCAADPAAWIASDLVLCIPFFRHILRQDYRYLIK